ncbi:MAG: class I SAM-dependent methyltransferase [Alphaproteobacteria bacterium]
MAASAWSDGYVADIPYLAGFYPDQAPAHLNFVCLLNGLEPNRTARSFTYCELGCGQGVTAALLAAANPEASIHAVDFNPAHIAAGEELASEAGLANLHLIESSFAALNGVAGRELPDFDFVTLHGIYSWVSPQNRRAIVEFMGRHLKPGGIVYVSYNCMPRWLAGLPVQRLLYELASVAPGRSDQRFRQALSLVEEMVKAGAHGLEENPVLKSILKEWDAGRASYFAHEYLNGNWQPLYHADVARELAEAKLNFVGSSTVFENFPAMTLSTEQQALLARIEVPELSETLKDFFVPHLLRRDVFVRGARRLSVTRREELMRGTRLALAVPRQRTRLEVEVAVGRASIEARHYEPIFDALAEAPRTAGELLALPALSDAATLQATEIAGMLVGSRQALPVPAFEHAPDTEPGRRFNAVIARRAVRDQLGKAQALASGLLGTGVPVTGVDCHVYRALAASSRMDADELARGLWSLLAASGDTLVSDGKALTGESECLAFFREHAGRALAEKLPLWRTLAAV